MIRNHTETRSLTFQWDADGKCTLANDGIEDFSVDELRELCRFLDALRGVATPTEPQTEAELIKQHDNAFDEASRAGHPVGG
jgi:hypothetical protein